MPTTKHQLTINFNGLRKNVVNSYNELIEFINNAEMDHYGELSEIDAEEMGDKLMSLHNAICFLCAIGIGEGEDEIKPLTDDPNFKLIDFKFE